ncbi:ribosomal protein S18-alanine N-acetyltransferase [Kitasatospora sp. NPDC052896]|uniref:ribosomal protein S18-alanine N-acetyltransferase n=1 Tax=Kitasatospora sp. NPDC052896 TaxID=3364061 RepID=UPI0037CB2001
MRWWDIEPLMVLERRLFPEDAWSPGMFWSELAEAHPGGSRYYTVATGPAGRIVGYAGLMAIGVESDVQTIAVDETHQGRGLGALLLADLVAESARRGCAELLLEVRIDNIRAQRLYERFGFEPIGIRRGYYQPANVDALVMRLDHPDPNRHDPNRHDLKPDDLEQPDTKETPHG